MYRNHGSTKIQLQCYNYVRQGRYVMPGVCLSVCLFVRLLATLRKNY